jgi:hypothetical protein
MCEEEKLQEADEVERQLGDACFPVWLGVRRLESDGGKCHNSRDERWEGRPLPLRYLGNTDVSADNEELLQLLSEQRELRLDHFLALRVRHNTAEVGPIDETLLVLRRFCFLVCRTAFRVPRRKDDVEGGENTIDCQLVQGGGILNWGHREGQVEEEGGSVECAAPEQKWMIRTCEVCDVEKDGAQSLG